MTHPLVVKNLSVLAGGSPLFDMSFTATPGCVTTIMGPSGSGKSSLLHAIAGILPEGLAAQGEVRLGGVSLLSVPAHRRHIGVMFQTPLLFPHMSVEQNLAFGLCKTATDRSQKIGDALSEVGLATYHRRDPAQLSGGQRTRIALMRCLLAGPKAILLDEPFSSLDQQLRHHVRDVVFATIKRRQIPAILVTHDPEDAEAANGPLIQIQHHE